MTQHKLFGFTLNSNNFCHSEKAENLANSLDFRLIQNLSMLIKAEVSLLGWRLEITSRSELPFILLSQI